MANHTNPGVPDPRPAPDEHPAVKETADPWRSVLAALAAVPGSPLVEVGEGTYYISKNETRDAGS
jgi:hypothetical protein